MPLPKSPVCTPALLAANRANSLKSTGPCTSRDKPRVSFNSFKHGRYAARPEELAERLLRAGYCREAALYRQVRWQIGQVFRPQGEAGWNRLYRLSAWVWSFRTRLGRSRSTWGVKVGAKPECALFSVVEKPRLVSRTRIRVEDPHRRIGGGLLATAAAGTHCRAVPRLRAADRQNKAGMSFRVKGHIIAGPFSSPYRPGKRLPKVSEGPPLGPGSRTREGAARKSDRALRRKEGVKAVAPTVAKQLYTPKLRKKPERNPVDVHRVAESTAAAEKVKILNDGR